MKIIDKILNIGLYETQYASISGLKEVISDEIGTNPEELVMLNIIKTGINFKFRRIL